MWGLLSKTDDVNGIFCNLLYSFRRWHWFVIDRRRCRVFCRFVVYFGRWKIILILHWFVVNLRGRGILHRFVVNLKLQFQIVLVAAKLFLKSKSTCSDTSLQYPIKRDESNARNASFYFTNLDNELKLLGHFDQHFWLHGY